MRWRIRPGTIDGATVVPGDKSIGHRALMIGALSDGVSRVENLPTGADVGSTAECLQALGVEISRRNGMTEIDGREFRSGEVLNAENSGTTMRLLTGILAGKGVAAKLIGDASLSRRPMGRIVEPLTLMGARIESTAGRPPLTLEPSRLHGITYLAPIASAQVKSSLLFAGLGAVGETSVEEPMATRDHTERMLAATGVAMTRDGNRIAIHGGQRPESFEMTVPGDISSAAFLLVAAAIDGSAIRVRSVGINPTRTGLVEILRDAGCSVEIVEQGEHLGEPVGEIAMSGRPVKPVTIQPDQVPGVIDEIPLLALLGTQAPGVSMVSGAAELRVKESDRIRSIVQSLSTLGADVVEQPDGFTIRGPVQLRGARVTSYGDHRIAMMLAVAGTIATGETVIDGAESAAVSFPEFPSILARLGGRIDVD